MNRVEQLARAFRPILSLHWDKRIRILRLKLQRDDFEYALMAHGVPSTESDTVRYYGLPLVPR
jgi:hypothetical protein